MIFILLETPPSCDSPHNLRDDTLGAETVDEQLDGESAGCDQVLVLLEEL